MERKEKSVRKCAETLLTQPLSTREESSPWLPFGPPWFQPLLIEMAFLTEIPLLAQSRAAGEQLQLAPRHLLLTLTLCQDPKC